MDAPVFLEIEEVLAIHEDQITRYGGSLGVRDMGLLESAVRAPTRLQRTRTRRSSGES
jgi:death on curing protein